MKNIQYVAIAATLIFSLTSCGGNGGTGNSQSDSTLTTQEPAKPKFEDVCKGQNAIAMTIKNYKFHMKGQFEFETSNFEVKQSSWTLINDSSALLKLTNYTTDELVGDRKDNQIDINVEFHGKKGKKIENGTFFHDYENDLYATATMLTSKGTVYFNWLDGMPKAGTVKINYFDSDKVCGTFTLSAYKPENEMIGTVRLNGDFIVGQ